MYENPRRGSQARNFGENVPKIVDLKSSSEQIFSENCRWVPLIIGRTTATTTTNQLNLIALCLLLKILAYFFSYSMKTVLLPLHGESESIRDQ